MPGIGARLAEYEGGNSITWPSPSSSSVMSRCTMRRFGVVGFGDGSVECNVAEVADVGMIELEYRFEVVTRGDSGSDGRMNGVVWYSAGRPCEYIGREVIIEVN
jgi:hypothetical protein